jgi:signal transduction histidine kinase
MNANQPVLRLFDPNERCESNGPVNEATSQYVADHRQTTGTVAPGDLELVLSAWQNATERLQRTHEVLCSEVRRLTEELEIKNRELARKNRLADLGQMASHVAHEVRNGLSPITLYLSWLRRRLAADSDGLRILNKLDAGCKEVQATVSDMLSFASDRQPIWRRFSLQELVDELCETLAPQLSAHEIIVCVDIPGISVWADRDFLRRALTNLLLNAVDVLPHGGGIWITAWQNEDRLEIEVADSGPGLSEENSYRIFEPFFTTKSEGAGLGLAIVQRVAESHGGEVAAQNCPEGGAAFTLRIPHRVMEAAA